MTSLVTNFIMLKKMIVHHGFYLSRVVTWPSNVVYGIFSLQYRIHLRVRNVL